MPLRHGAKAQHQGPDMIDLTKPQRNFANDVLSVFLIIAVMIIAAFCMFALFIQPKNTGLFLSQI